MGKVKELLGDPSRWSRGACARDAAGQPCQSVSPDARSWDLMGALNYLYGVSTERPWQEAARKIEESYTGTLPRALIHINDDPDLTHDGLMDLLERAGV